ncbi:MAG TPA: SDR family oxidoreductase [Candidatus Acidoferrales bacterium]|nr:SDR family oxidoreductase [Candidatus Acidoferrales bacterium]
MALTNPFDFTDQVVVITGPSGGLGGPLVRAFAQGGADLVLADIADDPLEALVDDVVGAGRRAIAVHVDVRDQAQVDTLAATASREFGKVDVLVNLAGVIRRIPSLEHSLEDWKLQIDVNLMGTWLTCRAIGRLMLERGHGRIINFASGAGFHGFPGYPGYTPSKHAVVGLTKVLAIEWSAQGVNVNAVAPGFTDTPLNQEVLDDPQRLQGVLNRVPQRKVLPADSVVGPTLFLASEAARWITGFTLRVDGGFNAT